MSIQFENRNWCIELEAYGPRSGVFITARSARTLRVRPDREDGGILLGEDSERGAWHTWCALPSTIKQRALRLVKHVID